MPKAIFFPIPSANISSKPGKSRFEGVQVAAPIENANRDQRCIVFSFKRSLKAGCSNLRGSQQGHSVPILCMFTQSNLTIPAIGAAQTGTGKAARCTKSKGKWLLLPNASSQQQLSPLFCCLFSSPNTGATDSPCPAPSVLSHCSTALDYSVLWGTLQNLLPSHSGQEGFAYSTPLSSSPLNGAG